MMMQIPISIILPGYGQIFFPKALRGALVPEREGTKIWARVVQHAKDTKTPAPRGGRPSQRRKLS